MRDRAVAKRELRAAAPSAQLATRLGDHVMFEHILRRQTRTLWQWGPVAQHMISLDGIDSAGEAGSDVMELIGRIDASDSTTDMLLDEFMGGFLHQARHSWAHPRHQGLLVPCPQH